MAKLGTLANGFLCYLASSLAQAGSETTINISTITTLTGDTLTTADFAAFGRGVITIDPLSSTNIEYVSFTAVDGTNIALTGATRNLSSDATGSATRAAPYHPVGTLCIISWGVHNIADIKTYIDTAIVSGGVKATDSVYGISKLSVAAASPTVPIAVGDNDPRVPTANPNTLYMANTPGIVSPYAGRIAPSGWLLCDGTAVSRSTYAALFAIIAPSQTFTVTIASPGVFSAVAHGLLTGDRLHLTTTGGLPSGLATNTDYWVSKKDADNFWLFDTQAHAAADAGAGTGTGIIVTTGSQSGVHTLYASNYGKGDGSTTFALPDFRGMTPYGYKLSDANFNVLNLPNTYVGEKTHVLTVTELAAHHHSAGSGNGSFAETGQATGSGGSAQTILTNSLTGNGNNINTGQLISDTGSNTGHNNLGPYVVTQFIIKT